MTGFAGGLVVPGGVEGEVAEEFAGGGVDDADVEVGDEDDDVGSGVFSAIPMWCSRLLWRSVILPVVSIRSWRTR